MVMKQPRACGQHRADTPSEETLRLRDMVLGDNRRQLLLRAEGSRVRDAAHNPSVELPLRAHAFDIDAQPSVHGASAHLEPTNVRSGRQPIRFVGIHAHEEPALAARRLPPCCR
jgi:hypothetical protein